MCICVRLCAFWCTHTIKHTQIHVHVPRLTDPFVLLVSLSVTLSSVLLFAFGLPRRYIYTHTHTYPGVDRSAAHGRWHQSDTQPTDYIFTYMYMYMYTCYT